jgi:hypothetical protein
MVRFRFFGWIAGFFGALIFCVCVSSASIAGEIENASSLNNSIAWIARQQNQDGSWGSDYGLRYATTVAVVDVLKSSGEYTKSYYAAISWIENHDAENVDSLARKIAVLFDHGNNIAPDLAQLNNSRPVVTQAGWGLSAAYSSSSIDTVLVLAALVKTGDAAGQSSAVNYLLSSQLADGGWSVVNASTSDYLITAKVVSGLSSIQNPSSAITASMNSATAYLAAVPATSSSLVLASVTDALYRRQGMTPAVEANIETLLTRQDVAGSWGDIYTTATVGHMLTTVLQLDNELLSARMSVSDQSLRAAINQSLGKLAYDNLTRGELLKLKTLDLRGTSVSSLSGLEYATNLRTLFIDYGVDVSSVAEVAGLNLVVDNDGVVSTYINHILDTTRLLTSDAITETEMHSLNASIVPTSDGLWQSIGPIQTGSEYGAYGAQLVMGDDGSAMVLRRSYDNYDPLSWYGADLSSTIYSQRYDATTGWQVPVAVWSGDTDESNWDGNLAIDGSGNGLALWRTGTGYGTLLAARYDSNTGWQAPITLTSPDVGSGAEMAMDSQGNAIAVWWQYDWASGTASTYAKRFDIELGWGSTYTLGEGLLTYGYGNTNLAMDADGNALVVWSTYDSAAGNYVVYARRYDRSQGWESPVVVNTVGQLSNLMVASDSQGNGYVIRRYVDHSTGIYTLYCRYYDKLLGWSGEEVIATASNEINNILIKARGQGHAVLTWTEYSGAGSTTYIRRYDSTSGWLSSEVVGAGNVGEIALTDSGDAHVAVTVYNTHTNYAKRYDAVQGWRNQVSIGTDLWDMNMELNNNGDAMLLGRDYSMNSSDLRVYRYLAGEKYYSVRAGDTWESISDMLYSSASVAQELQSALGNPALEVGNLLQNLPSELIAISTTTAPSVPFYRVEAGDTWESISAFLFGTTKVSNELRSALGGVTLVAGDKLTGLPGNIWELVNAP